MHFNTILSNSVGRIYYEIGINCKLLLLSACGLLPKAQCGLQINPDVAKKVLSDTSFMIPTFGFIEQISIKDRHGKTYQPAG
jgi:hypothetical protein